MNHTHYRLESIELFCRCRLHRPVMAQNLVVHQLHQSRNPFMRRTSECVIAILSQIKQMFGCLSHQFKRLVDLLGGGLPSRNCSLHFCERPFQLCRLVPLFIILAQLLRRRFQALKLGAEGVVLGFQFLYVLRKTPLAPIVILS